MAAFKKSIPTNYEEYKKKLGSNPVTNSFWTEKSYNTISGSSSTLPDTQDYTLGAIEEPIESLNYHSSQPYAFAKNALDWSVPKEEEPKEKKKSPAKRTNPLEGARADVDGPILKLYLLQKGAFVIGWFEFIDEGLRQLMTMQRFTAKNGINIYAKEGPQMVSDTILLPGIRKDRDDQHIQNAFRNTEDAISGLNNYLEALREFTNLVRGINEVDNKIGTKINGQYVHIF